MLSILVPIATPAKRLPSSLPRTMTTTNLLLVFIAFLAGQLFNAVCSGLAHPQAVNSALAAPDGWSLSSVIVLVVVVLLVHDLAIVWWLFSTRRNKKSSSPSTTLLLPCRLPLLLLPPKPLLLLPPPADPNPRLVIRLSIPRWMISLRVYFAPLPQRALMAHQGNWLVVGIVWQALAAIKASRPELVKYEHGLRLVMKTVIPRPLGLRGVYRGRVVRLPRVLLAQQDLLHIVGGALAIIKASKVKALPGMHQEDSATLVDESLDDKKSIYKSPSTSRPSHLALVGHLAAAAMSRKAAKQVIQQESFTKPEEINDKVLPSPTIQEEAYPDVPPPRPSLVSLLERIPIEMLRQRFSKSRFRPQEPEASHAFIEEVEEEHDDQESLSGDSDDAGLFSYEAFADDLDTRALFDRPSGPCLPKFDISRPPSLSNIAARFDNCMPSAPRPSRAAILAGLRHPASTCS
ncbi:hypothetical protein FB45DRAFT_941993 [Roridomyces roridus]|uniref:Uncharacterized protein n=1 Tax=Roridomyces roridus TaxID=1738132 RepID=A0AAD7B558_9AGAR|nr:hypothetical protein FB45DRAFT_941993 [Roridomyces roridus]